MTRTFGAMVLSGALILGGGACSSPGGDDPAPAASSETPAGPTPTGEPFVVEPLDSIDGAEAWTSDGVTLAVPAGMKKQRTEGDGQVSLAVFEADAPQDAVVVSVVAEQDGPYTEASVDESAAVAQAQIAASGGTDMTISPVEWDSWPYATAVLGSIEQDGAQKEGGVVQTMTPDGSSLVGVSVKAPEGGLEESWQYEVLRTVRPAP